MNELDLNSKKNSSEDYIIESNLSLIRASLSPEHTWSKSFAKDDEANIVLNTPSNTLTNSDIRFCFDSGTNTSWLDAGVTNNQLYQQNEEIISELQASNKDHEMMIKRITSLEDVVSKKEDIINAKKELIAKIEKESMELQDNLNEKLAFLTKEVMNNSRIKRVNSIAIAFFVFFSIALLLKLFFNFEIGIVPWYRVGILFSTIIFLISYFIQRELKRVE